MAISAVWGVAQPIHYQFQRYADRDGIANNIVGAITQDTRGFLWFGTAEGLSRFDGRTFFNYRAVAADPHSLLENRVDNLGIDNQGKVWVAYNAGGISWFDEDAAAFRHITSVDGQAILDVRRFGFDQDGYLWAIASPLGLVRIHTQTFELERIDSSFTVGNVRVDGLNRVWVNAFDGVSYILDEKRNKVSFPQFPPGFEAFIMIDVLIDDASRARLVLYAGGVWCFEPDLSASEQCPAVGLDQNPHVSMTSGTFTGKTSDAHTYWYSTTDRGIFVVENGATTAENIVTDASNQMGLLTNRINILFAAQNGDIWAGTEDGVYLIRRIPDYMKLFALEDGLVDVRSAMVDDTRPGHWWIFSWGGGVAMLNAETGKNRYLFNNDNRKRWPFQMEFSNDGYKLADGRYAVAHNQGVAIVDPQHLQSENYTYGYDVEGIIQDGDDIYLGSKMGLHAFNLNTKQFREIHPGFMPPNVYVNRIRRWQGDTLVLATDNGLYLWAHRDSVPENVYLPGFEPFNYVKRIDIFEDEAWLATNGGLVRYNLRNAHIERITKGNPIPTSRVRNIYRDTQNRLWFPTYNGIYILDGDASRVLGHLTTAQGLPANGQIQDNGYLDGEMLFLGYGNYLVAINTALYEPASRLPDGIYLMDQADYSAGIRRNTQLGVFPHNHAPLDVVFSAPEYYGTELPFFYRLTDSDVWRPAGGNRRFTLANMSSGEYHLQITSDTLARIPSAELFFSVDVPWWRKWWFLAAMMIAGLWIFRTFYSYRMRQIMEIQQVRNRISRDLHDDVGATLSSIRILSGIAVDKLHRGEPEQAAALLQKVNVHAAHTTEKMSDTIWAINPANDNLDHLISRLRQQFGDLLASKATRLLIEYDEIPGFSAFPLESRKHIYLICKEAVNNALCHSNASEITIHITQKYHKIHIRIADNGTGFTGDAIPGNGLANMRQRASLLKSSIHIDSDAHGTIIAIKIPIP